MGATSRRAAIYCRKSTTQDGADPDAKSVARQEENARKFAALKGWALDEAHCDGDDATSGADIKRLVKRQRLIDTIRAGAPFDVLIMRDSSRFSRRDGDEAFTELKEMALRGVELWFYQEGQQSPCGTFAANVVGFVNAEMNAEYRRSVAKWTREAMERKARAGHATGNPPFGYDTIPVNGHKEYRITPEQAAVARRIYELYAAGHGRSSIAHILNNEGAISPRAQQGRMSGWVHSSVRAILKNSMYRGRRERGQRRKRDATGQVAQKRQPSSGWTRADAPELRIVDEKI